MATVERVLAAVRVATPFVLTAVLLFNGRSRVRERFLDGNACDPCDDHENASGYDGRTRSANDFWNGTDLVGL